MYKKTGILYSAVAVLTFLAVEAKILPPSEAMERKETCKTILSQECPGSADVVPFAYPPTAEGIDNACSVASAYFPCFKKIASTCDSADEESKYFLTYLDACDSSNPFYNGIRKSIGCMKLAEKRNNETCIKPREKLAEELAAFGEKIDDFGISSGDWTKIEFGLMVRHEQICMLQVADECNEEYVETSKYLFDRFGVTRAVTILSEKKDLVEKVLDNLNLEDKLKMKLRQDYNKI